MLAEQAVKDACARTQAFNRAVRIAARLDLIANRRCEYELDCTILRGQIQGDQWYETYDANVKFDEDSGEVLDYGCTCQGDGRAHAMCRHAAALALSFIAVPDRFTGYEADYACATAPDVLKYLEACEARRARMPLAPALSGIVHSGQIDLSVAVCEPDGYFARWQIDFSITDGESSYAVRNLPDLIEACDSRAFFGYGKKLAFVHVPECFTPRARRIVDFIRRVVNTDPSWNRREHWDGSTARRNLFVSAFNLGELLELCEGAEVAWRRSHEADGERTMRILAGDPPLSASLAKRSDTSWEISCAPRYQAIDCGTRLFLADEGTVWRCSEKLQAAKDLLVRLLDPRAAAAPLPIAQRDIARFCAVGLPQIAEALGCAVPDELQALVPEPCLLEFYLDAQGKRCECEAKARYGDELVAPGVRSARRVGRDETIRDTAMESAALELVARYFPVTGVEGVACTQDDDDVFKLLKEGVEELLRWGSVFTTKAFDRLMQFAKPVVTTGVSVKSGLLSMHIDAGSVDAAEVAAILSSYRKKKRYHRLKNGIFVSFEGDAAREAGLDAFDELADELGLTLAQIRAGIVEVPAYHAFLLDARIDDARKDREFKRFVEHFEGMRAESHPLDAALASRLRSYQFEGFNWLCSLSDSGFGGILADEMGLGKSVQAIAYLSAHAAGGEAGAVAFGSDDAPAAVAPADDAPATVAPADVLSADQPALIVCPASLVYNWLAEFAKFAPGIPACALAGSADERASALAQRRACVYIVSYDLARIDVELLAQGRYFAVILDEAQYIKNHATKTAQAVKTFEARHRFALTGTPIENRLVELWSIFDFIMPGMLGSYRRFKGAYEVPIVDGDTERADRLAAKVGPLILRRLKADVARDLPDKAEIVVRVQPSLEQRRVYGALEARLATMIAKKSDREVHADKVQIFAELTRLRQVCCDPRLVYEGFEGPSAKVQAIADLVGSAVDSGQKALVFSAFTSFLDLIADELAQRGWAFHTITGKIPKARRVALVEAFNEDAVPVFLVSLKAGGTGLNLVGASIVVHADPWWNAAARDQATDRAHRIGQTRDVSVYQVICADSIEERIIALQEAKQELADRIVGSRGGAFAGLSREQLLGLLADDDLGPED